MYVKIYNVCSLKKAIAFHRQKRKEDNNNVMTVVLKNVQKTAGAKPILDDLIVAMDKGISLCMYVCMYVCTVCRRYYMYIHGRYYYQIS